MPTWWLWREKPAPKKKIAEIDLPFSYLAAEPLSPTIEPPRYDKTFAFQLVGTYDPAPDPVIDQARETIRNAIGMSRTKQPLAVGGVAHEYPVGAMRTLRLDVTSGQSMHRTQRSRYWITPQVYQFLDAKKHLPDEVLRDWGQALDRERGYRYFVQPQVFDAAGEFLSGDFSATTRVIKLEDTIKVVELMKQEGEVNELGNLILVALDSFMERGAPDPRFNPGRF